MSRVGELGEVRRTYLPSAPPVLHVHQEVILNRSPSLPSSLYTPHRFLETSEQRGKTSPRV